MTQGMARGLYEFHFLVLTIYIVQFILHLSDCSTWRRYAPRRENRSRVYPPHAGTLDDGTLLSSLVFVTSALGNLTPLVLGICFG